MGGSLKGQTDLAEQGEASNFAGISARNPAERTSTPDDIAQAVIFALTGQTPHTDGGEPLT